MASIYDSFNHKLPGFPLFGTQKNNRTHKSGATTMECTPPRCGIDIPVSPWTELASRLCLKPHRADLIKKPLPGVENLIGLKSEGDVVNASTLYLTHPVHVGYQTLYPSDCYLNELTKTRQDGTSSSRVDRAYFLGEPNNDEHPGKSTNIFAALEYKKFRAIDRSQFKAGIVTDFNAFDKAQQRSRYVDRYEEDNVMVLLKQAVHYVWRYETPFVALCDYNTLVLLYMPKQNDNDGGPYTYMTIGRGDSKEMRKAYLGFLLAARSHAEGNRNWRLSQARQDLFLEAEQWWQQHASSASQKNPDRSGRNDNPRHDTPSSQGSDVPMTGVQRGRGDDIILLISFLAEDLHNIPSKHRRNVEAELHVYDFDRQLSLNKERELLLHRELYIQNQRATRFEEAK